MPANINTEINARIKQIRIDAGLNQRDFGKECGISGAAIAQIEINTNNASDRTISEICRKFRIRKTWLLEGRGEMKLPPPEDDEIIDEILQGDNEFIKGVIRWIARRPDLWDSFERIVTEFIEDNKKAGV